MRTGLLLVTLFALALPACGPSMEGPRDAAVADGGADLAPAADLAVTGDLADMPDLATPRDAGALADLSPPADLATIADLAPPADPRDLAAAADLATGRACVDVGAAPVVLATAGSSDDFAFTVDAQSASATSWAEAGNEALVLDVLRGAALVGHLVLHQGRTPFSYGMHLGALAAGDPIAVRVSARSAAAVADKHARVCAPTLRAAAELGPAGEGLRRAPVFLWPVAKTFDDLPLVLGWSPTARHYEIVYTSENGGTVASCGGGAGGMRAEFARWGRGCDIEGVYTYGATPQWLRCTGTTAVAAGAPRLEGSHPIFYYGDGHNRLFESRGGYGKSCGSGGPERADGDLVGWNVQNPGNDPARDADFAVILRPLPVDLDALGFATSAGRREALVDSYAPWLYRLTHAELAREGKIDNAKLLPLERYLYVDLEAADVDGSGDRVCAASVGKGFVLRVHTAAGVTLDGPQMTASYMGGNGWKRLAIPLDRVYAAAELTGMTFDAYDQDGIYLLAIGDAFMVRPSGDNGATLERLRSGSRSINVYVDDDSSGCTGGVNHDGPAGDAVCVGGQYDFTP